MKEILAILGLKAKATVAEAVDAIKKLLKEIEELKSAEAVAIINEAKEATEVKVHELEGKLEENVQVISNLEGKLHDLVSNVTREKKRLDDDEINELAKAFEEKNPDVKKFWICADGQIYIFADMARRHGVSIGFPEPYEFEA